MARPTTGSSRPKRTPSGPRPTTGSLHASRRWTYGNDPVDSFSEGRVMRGIASYDAERDTTRLITYGILGAFGLGLLMVLVGSGIGWVIIALATACTLSQINPKPRKSTPTVRPKPTYVSPRTTALLTEWPGMLAIGVATLVLMVLVGSLAT